MSVLVKGWSIPTDGCCGCYFRTGKYCGILSKNERVLEYAERFTRPDNCPLTELIRCKDCTHQHTNTITGMKQCLLPNGYTPLGDDKDYCSYAERRGEE